MLAGPRGARDHIRKRRQFLISTQRGERLQHIQALDPVKQ